MLIQVCAAEQQLRFYLDDYFFFQSSWSCILSASISANLIASEAISKKNHKFTEQSDELIFDKWEKLEATNIPASGMIVVSLTVSMNKSQIIKENPSILYAPLGIYSHTLKPHRLDLNNLAVEQVPIFSFPKPNFYSKVGKYIM